MFIMKRKERVYMPKTYSYDFIKYLNDQIELTCSLNMLRAAKDEKNDNDSSLLLINNILNNQHENTFTIKVKDIKKIVGNGISRNFKYWSLDIPSEDLDKLIIESYKRVIADDSLFMLLKNDMFMQALNFIDIKDNTYRKRDATFITGFMLNIYKEKVENEIDNFKIENENINLYSYDELKYLNDKQLVQVNYSLILHVFKTVNEVDIKQMLKKYIQKDQGTVRKFNINIPLNELKEVNKYYDITNMDFGLDMPKSEYNEALINELLLKLNDSLFSEYIMNNDLKAAKKYALNNLNFNLNQQALALKVINVKKKGNSECLISKKNK